MQSPIDYETSAANCRTEEPPRSGGSSPQRPATRCWSSPESLCSSSPTCCPPSRARRSRRDRHRLRRNRGHTAVASLTTPLRQALHEHATTLLAELGIDEPVTWSSPADLANGLELPGIDIDALDTATISRLVVEEHRPLGEAARTLGVHIEHVRLALERLDRPPHEWVTNSAPPHGSPNSASR